MTKAAIAAYGTYWREMEKLYADPTGKSAHLNQYAAAAALKNAEADAKRAHALGSIYTGSVALTDQTVTKVVATGRIPNATISTCLDISHWQTVDAETKKPVPLPSNRLTKYRIVSTVEKYAQGWRVTSDEPQGKPC
ncbi:secreted protein/lipoprotein [Streptomyces rishiriensis]|uniref:secreted protein/lipoprotein n=1 Tax=Streptomyces rishiriensis TaxID=68264 RepID=UPI0033F9F538